MVSINAGDIVDVSLHGGGFLNDHIIISVPGGTQIYWELENPDNNRLEILGPTFDLMVKKS